WRLRRRVARLPLVMNARALAANRTVRLRGTVEANGSRPHEFVLRLRDGARVRVRSGAAAQAGSLRLLDARAIVPGTAVQVSGVLEAMVDPSVPSVAPRVLPLAWRVTWSRDMPLVVTSAPPPARLT